MDQRPRSSVTQCGNQENNMNAEFLRATALATFVAFSASAALADTATFTSAPLTGCPNCTATDSSGLVVSALGHLLPNGWDVRTGNGGLYFANRTGGVFTIPASNFPGKSFDLTGLKLFAYGATSMSMPVTFTLYAYHFGIPTADTVQVTVNSQATQDVTLSDPRLRNIDTLIIRYDPLQVRYVYFIETRFTPH
ncbi:hypothetical protein [Methylosinus sp. Sm6]|uniref:hypothetical protein n=1 Tax=Methylosinus sp. Sm6 TaxID=2866948 RepID=UPI001C996DA1|nr:hypothetical protein [Methylosinus sp. Sm6]MBY6240895.1 hypothetical protein [Methylosinus sp. Sm6]